MATQTNWHVLTGGPNSGKSTTISALQNRGFAVIHESAREILTIQRQPETEIALEDVLVNDPQRAQIGFACMAAASHYRHGEFDKLTFLDRGVPDALAFLNAQDVESTEIMDYLIGLFRYASVFVLDSTPYDNGDTVRRESEVEARRIHPFFYKTYRSLGYEPIVVPVLPVEDRVDFILDRVNSVGK